MPQGDNGAGNGDGNGSRSGTPTRESMLADFRDELTALYRGNDVPARERKLNQRLFKLRLKNRELEQQVEQLNGGKPKDGQVVLSKDEAAEYDAFKKLNLKTADLVTIVKEHGEQRTRLAERDAEELYVDVADAMGFENLPAFMRFMEREKLHVEFKDVQQRDEESGKMITAKVPMVRLKADEKAQLEPLADYVDREVPEFIEIFQTPPAEGDEGNAETQDEGNSAPRSSGLAAHLARVTAGDAGARRAALSTSARQSSGGVTMPVTRNARPSSGKARDEKRQREAYEEKRKNPEYAQL